MIYSFELLAEIVLHGLDDTPQPELTWKQESFYFIFLQKLLQFLSLLSFEIHRTTVY